MDWRLGVSDRARAPSPDSDVTVTGPGITGKRELSAHGNLERRPSLFKFALIIALQVAAVGPRGAEPRRAEAAIPTLRTDMPPGPPPRGRVLRRAVCQSQWASVGSQSALHNPAPDQKWGPAAAVAYNPQVEAAATAVT